MDANLQKTLLDKVYEKRKAATLDLERLARDALARNDRARINAFVQQLCALLKNNPSSAGNPQSVNARNGGLIGLAGIGIALGIEIAAYLEQIVPPVLECFVDPDSKIRYFACESFYNIAKVCKGEILMYFNEIFDALSKLAADTELSVKNGAELLDRLLKDIVCEAAPHYISQYQDVPLIKARQDAIEGNSGGLAELDVAREKSHAGAEFADDPSSASNKAFSLARFVPLLAERIYVLSPFTRNYLVSWITVLDSIPDLELVSYLPHFLDGLLKYLSDPNTDVRVATARVLADFLREIQEAAEFAHVRKDVSGQGDASLSSSGKHDAENKSATEREPEESEKERSLAKEDGSWITAQEIHVDYSAIMEILLNHIAYPDEEIQATTQQWIAELLYVIKGVVVPFTPRLIPAILPNIAHHSPAIQSSSNVLNAALYHVVEGLPWSSATQSNAESAARSPVDKKRAPSSDSSKANKSVPEGSGASKDTSAMPNLSESQASEKLQTTALYDPFDLQATVNVLTLQLIDEHEETRVSALEWLLMLHKKAPRRILGVSDGTFPALLKTLSDPSEDVVRWDLKLLAQVSSASDDTYSSYLTNLVSLFSTDRRLLETRGSLIIRQLCVTLHTERVFRTLAGILEKDEDLEFASIMVTNLNMILVTSPELSDFRKRLKNLETRDGQQLFIGIYRSWCHNAVATLCLCLLAQAYEHASNLLSVFPELEITVPFLIQIDKLVQLLESPIFMTLRLQLLEPDRYPHLLKTLYGLLMLLPQSSAFATLRNRLNAVSALGYMHIGPSARATQGAALTATTGSPVQGASLTSGSGPSANNSGGSTSNAGATRNKIIGSNRDDLRWNELLSHFKVVQGRHERARRNALEQQETPSAGPLTSLAEDVSGTISGDGSQSGLGLSSESVTHTTGGHANLSMGDRLGTRRRLGSSPSGQSRASSAGVRPGPSSVVKSRLRGGSSAENSTTPQGLSAAAASSSNSFFRLPIGAAAAGSGASIATSMPSPSSSTPTGSVTPTAASSERPTSPAARRGGGGNGSIAGQAMGALSNISRGSAESSLLGRTLGSSSSSATQSRSKS